MIRCKFCGAEIPDKTRFCSLCGGKVKTASKVAPKTYNVQKKRNPIKTGVLIWSIVNIVLGVFGFITILPFIASILGVVSVILLILAQDRQEPKSEKTKVRIAVILNIIASAILVISFLLFVALIFAGLVMPFFSATDTMNIETFMQMYPYID